MSHIHEGDLYERWRPASEDFSAPLPTRARGWQPPKDQAAAMERHLSANPDLGPMSLVERLAQVDGITVAPDTVILWHRERRPR